MSTANKWEFKVDVGGTFTDYIAISPERQTISGKLLSSGCLKGSLNDDLQSNEFFDDNFSTVAPDLFKDFKIRFYHENEVLESRVIDFNNDSGKFTLTDILHIPQNTVYELFTGEVSPVIAIRLVTGTGLAMKFPQVNLRLGTTIGTNALLERKGAKVGLLCTKGFKDVWTIGNQSRSALFDLKVQQPKTLLSAVKEIDERVDTNGNVLAPVNRAEVEKACRELQEQGIEALAICLVNSYVNQHHENEICEIARQCGFEHISVSSKLSRRIKLLDRGDTTLVDAYLTPIIAAYVKSINKSLPDATLRLMTSAGGLVSTQNLTAKDLLFSGPAGGVNGFVSAALAEGFNHAIGFDMGGTSTDVKRYGGEYEYQYETTKAGVRVVAPMFAIETVAAGGGSICHYDGQRLLVGPESAGASPGPACYGSGGPLTVTDLNLFNGKIDADAFPFKLDIEAVEAQLSKISEQIFASEGRRMSLLEIADGFSRIADFIMAEAIRNISSAKGYKPADHLLVAFGGAGPQHACSIASLLKMEEILIHPYSGILSAYGIGLTGIQVFEERSILKIFNGDVEKFVGGQLNEMKKTLTEKLMKEGVDPQNSQCEVTFDMRYVGENESISVKELNALPEFEKKHLQYFGYIHENRHVELVTIRVKLSENHCEHTAQAKVKEARHSAKIKQTLVVRGVQYQATLYDRYLLKSDQKIQGPAVIREGLSTIVIEPGWQAKVCANGDLLLSRFEVAAALMQSGLECDPVRLELFNKLFTSIASRMGAVLRKISISVNVKERLDFSCAILSPKGELVVNAPHIPVHLGAMGDCVKALIKEVKELKPGMVFLTNDPALGGSHLPDLTVISPVFSDDGEKLLFFTASRAHHAEIGGIKPGSFCPFATNLEEEGVVFRNFLLADKTGFREKELVEALSSAVWPSRNPLENVADLKAAVAAAHSAKNELLEVIEEYGSATVLAYMDYMKDSAAAKVKNYIHTLKPGTYEFSDSMDDGAPIKVKVEISTEKIKIDFSGSAAVNKQTMNANLAIVKSAVMYVIRCLVNEDMPLNEGALDPVELIVPESFLNPSSVGTAIERAAVSAGNVEVSQKICDVLLGAFQQCAASQGTMNNVIFGNDSFGFYETLGGGIGASENYHGCSAIHSHMTNTRLTDVEIIERNYPVRIAQFGIRQGSGGRGAFAGGDGLYRENEFLEAVEISLITQRRQSRPFGLNGGESGLCGENYFKAQASEGWQKLDSLCSISAKAGDRLRILTPGGGAWGVQKNMNKNEERK